MRIRRSVAIVGLIGVLAALGAAGTAMAQTPNPSPGQAANSYRSQFLDKLAEALGVTPEKLKSAFTDARNSILDQAVKDGKLTQQQADRIKANPRAGLGFGFGFGLKGNQHQQDGPRVMFLAGGSRVWNAIAKALDMSPQDLAGKLRSGQTLAQVAGDKTQDVRNAIKDTLKPDLDKLVEKGKMTQQQADKILDRIMNADLNSLGRAGIMRGLHKDSDAKPKPHNPATLFRGGPAWAHSL